MLVKFGSLVATAVLGCTLAVSSASAAESAPPAAVPSPSSSSASGLMPAKPAPGHWVSGNTIPGHYIVTLKAGENPRSLLAAAHVTPRYVYNNALNGFAAALNQGQLNALRHNPAVQGIEPDAQVTSDSYLTETMDASGQPWGLDRIDQRNGLSRTYTWWSSGSYGAGTGVRAYVIDTGIATADADFGGRAIDVYDAFGGNGQDCNGHGTHVAGTIGGRLYGVAKSVLLRGVRVLPCTGQGSTASIIAGIDWVRAHAVKPAVANISIGGPKSVAENAAVTNLVNSGVFVAVAAGNSNNNACSYSPSSATGTLTVAAEDWTDTRAAFSNYGSCVDLYAPGVRIKSDWLNGGTNLDSGTSMAAPHVAGVAALLKSDYGDRTSGTISNWILNNASLNYVKANLTGTPNRLLFMSRW